MLAASMSLALTPSVQTGVMGMAETGGRRGQNDVVSDLLGRPMYDCHQAAHLLAMSASTLHWWLEGRGADYRPVLRESATGSRVLTWGEFVEARYVRAYRKDHGVSLQRIRAFIDRLREETRSPHPLATEKPWVGPGRRLLLSAQRDLEPDLWSVYEPSTGQYLLTAPAQSYLAVVEFDTVEDTSIVRRLRPAGRSSPVVIDPELRAGLASVGGISTSAIRELVEAGEAIETVAEDYGLDLDDTIAALDFERTLAAHSLPAVA